jgi:hypothetical protein
MSRSKKVVTLVALLGLFAGLLLAAPGAVADQSRGAQPTKRARFDWSPTRTALQISALRQAGAAAGALQTFTRTIHDGTSFTYTMVGKDPFVAQSTPATTIKTYLQPVIVKFGGQTWDPTVGDSCDSTSALIRTQKSPIFKAQAWSFGGTGVGTAQYVDAFQRAGFYDQTRATGINPGYHVKLKLITLPAMTVNIPAADSVVEDVIGCGNSLLGGIEINYWDNLLQTSIIPSLASKGVKPATLPVFLFGNVVMYDTVAANCCILGYHNAFKVGSTLQTYSNAIYDNSGAFSGSSDISALSHEVGEWLNDPNTVNPTKPWGNIGQVTGCQNNLEVGDPLSGTVFSDALNGKTYHPQELAFSSWFYHRAPSGGVNGWYSNQGTFKTAAAACP